MSKNKNFNIDRSPGLYLVGIQNEFCNLIDKIKKLNNQIYVDVLYDFRLRHLIQKY